MGETVPARMPRWASVDGTAGRALGLETRQIMSYKWHTSSRGKLSHLSQKCNNNVIFYLFIYFLIDCYCLTLTGRTATTILPSGISTCVRVCVCVGYLDIY